MTDPVAEWTYARCEPLLERLIHLRADETPTQGGVRHLRDSGEVVQPLYARVFAEVRVTGTLVEFDPTRGEGALDVDGRRMTVVQRALPWAQWCPTDYLGTPHTWTVWPTCDARGTRAPWVWLARVGDAAPAATGQGHGLGILASANGSSIEIAIPSRALRRVFWARLAGTAPSHWIGQPVRFACHLDVRTLTVTVDTIELVRTVDPSRARAALRARAWRARERRRSASTPKRTKGAPRGIRTTKSPRAEPVSSSRIESSRIGPTPADRRVRSRRNVGDVPVEFISRRRVGSPGERVLGDRVLRTR